MSRVIVILTKNEITVMGYISRNGEFSALKRDFQEIRNNSLSIFITLRAIKFCR